MREADAPSAVGAQHRSQFEETGSGIKLMTLGWLRCWVSTNRPFAVDSKAHDTPTLCTSAWRVRGGMRVWTMPSNQNCRVPRIGPKLPRCVGPTRVGAGCGRAQDTPSCAANGTAQPAGTTDPHTVTEPHPRSAASEGHVPSVKAMS